MKKIIIIFIICFISFFNLEGAKTFAYDEELSSEVSEYCTKGEKVLTYYESLDDKTDGLKYLNAAKYFFYQAIRLDKSSANALIGMAKISLYQNKTRDAKNALMMALNFNPENPRVAHFLGDTFFQEGDYTEAIDYYDWAYRHGYKYNYNTNFQLAVCYEKIYEQKKAIKHYNEALKIKPESQAVKDRLKKMDEANKEVFVQKTE